MLLELTGRNVDITPRVEKRIKKLMSKLDKLLDDSASAHVILSTEKHRHRTEIILTWRDHNFTGVAETADLDTSVSQAIEKINRQTLKQKEKFAARRRSARKAPEIGVAAEEVAAAEPRIIRSPLSAVKPLTSEEAALHLSQTGDQFLVFRDAERDRVAVIYRRKDGHYGLIEP
ncbi:MAG: ribosome-associated translation inhibitor RaiA [Acidobacteria bacterium]|nr:ribosome-associated translation inhibitor RaiA [Acidobacteriota bacterium]